MATIDTIANRSTGTAIAGKAYFETSTNKFIVFNGSAWIELDSDGTGTFYENRWGASFDGSVDYIDIPDSTALETTAFTWSAWFYCTAINRHNTIVDSSSHTSYFFGYHIRVNTTNKIRFASYHTNDALDSTTTVSANTWYHVAATHEAGSDKLYINGSLEASGSASNFSTTDAANLRIGSSSIFSLYHQGLIDEVAFFNSALSASDVTAIYNSGVPADLTSLSPVGWWRMGDDSNDTASDGTAIATITDSSGNGNDATQATASNQPTFKALDQSTTSLSFDGSTDYLSAPTITALNAPTAFSSSAWFAYSGSTTASAENIITAGSASGNRFYLQVFNPQNIRYGHSTAYLDISVSTLNSGTWYHLATVHNGTSLEVFLNGVSQGTASVNAPQSGYGTNFKIGAYAVGGITPIGHFEGALDNVAIFNSALSASDVASLASSRGAHIVNDLSLSPTAYYRMGEDDSLTDGASASQITDASGNGNHATQATAANQPTASIDPVIYV